MSAGIPTGAGGPADLLSPLLNTLGVAVRTGNERAFRTVISDRPEAAATADLIWSNLRALRPTRFDVTTTGAEAPLPAGRRPEWPTDARLVRVRIDWQLSDDTHPAAQLRWFTVVPGAGNRWLLAATTDGPDGSGGIDPTPIWLLEPVTVAVGNRSTAIGGRGVDVAGWTQVLDRAAAAVIARIPASLRPSWNGRLVAELPGDVARFEQLLGATPGSRSGIAAVTWPEGVVPARAPLRMVVDPGPVAGLPTLGREVLATHEAVHVATRSPVAATPLWLVEGFADWVAYDRWPAAAGPALDPLLAAVAAGHGPLRLPSDADFAVRPAGDLNLRYAEAWTACRFVARTRGAATLARLYAAAGREPDTAIQRTLGQTETDLVAGWRADLARQARNR